MTASDDVSTVEPVPSERDALLPVVLESAHRAGRSFWGRLGRGLLGLATTVGRGVVAVYRAIDPDARRHLAQMPLLGLTMLLPRKLEPEPIPDPSGHRPVVFVHGLGGGQGNFLPAQAWFRLWGRRRTYSASFPDGASLEQMVEHLRTYIRRALEVNDLPAEAKVDLICHSMGGILARLALEDPGTAGRVATLVTLGTPHAGTYAARFAGTEHTVMLRPDSSLMDRLARQVPWRGLPDLPRLVCFWSGADMFLLPPTTACVAGADNQELEGFTHLSYVIHPKGWHRMFLAVADPGTSA